MLKTAKWLVVFIAAFVLGAVGAYAPGILGAAAGSEDCYDNMRCSAIHYDCVIDALDRGCDTRWPYLPGDPFYCSTLAGGCPVE